MAWLEHFWSVQYPQLFKDGGLEEFDKLVVRIGGLRHDLREKIGEGSAVLVEHLEWIEERLNGPTIYC